MEAGTRDNMEVIPRAKRGLLEPSSDMISDLPKNEIDHIIQFLPIKDAARMSALSKTWRSNWLSLPRLVFHDEFSDPIDSEFDALKWLNIISNILFLHQGPIIEFSVTIPNLPTMSQIDVIPWLSFVLRNGVKSLTFYSIYEERLFRLPSCIIGRLSSFRGLRNLLSIILFKVVFEANVFDKFFSACPVLEKLTLALCTTPDPIIINLSNFKVLDVIGAFRSISFKSASSLVSVTLFLNIDDSIEWADIMKSLATLCRLQRLSLDGCAYESLANYGVSRILPTTFKHLKIIKLSSIGMNHKEFLFAIALIRSCPYVEEIVLSMRVRQSNEVYEEELKIPGTGKTNNVEDEYTFNHLRSIHLTNVQGLGLEMKLISFLLASSPSLDRLSFTCHKLKARAKSQLHRQILQFRRVSPRAEVKQTEYVVL